MSGPYTGLRRRLVAELLPDEGDDDQSDWSDSRRRLSEELDQPEPDTPKPPIERPLVDIPTNRPDALAAAARTAPSAPPPLARRPTVQASDATRVARPTPSLPEPRTLSATPDRDTQAPDEAAGLLAQARRRRAIAAGIEQVPLLGGLGGENVLSAAEGAIQSGTMIPRAIAGAAGFDVPPTPQEQADELRRQGLGPPETPLPGAVSAFTKPLLGVGTTREAAGFLGSLPGLAPEFEAAGAVAGPLSRLAGRALPAGVGRAAIEGVTREPLTTGLGMASLGAGEAAAHGGGPDEALTQAVTSGISGAALGLPFAGLRAPPMVAARRRFEASARNAETQRLRSMQMGATEGRVPRGPADLAASSAVPALPPLDQPPTDAAPAEVRSDIPPPAEPATPAARQEVPRATPPPIEEPEVSPKVDTSEEPSHIPATPEPAKVAGIGRETQARFSGEAKEPARYRVVEADQLQPSHSAQTFQPNPNYPEGVQGRDYARDKAAQEHVRRVALALDPDELLDHTGAVDRGPPTITPEGTVVAGNNRVMSTQLSREVAPEKYAAYRARLQADAANFGIDPADVAGMKHPVLVREIQGAGPDVLQRLNRLSDQTETKAKRGLDEAATRAAALRQAPEALEHLRQTIEPDETIADYLGRKAGRDFVDQLVLDKVIAPQEVARYRTPEGGLTDEGKLLIRRTLLASTVDDPATIDRAPAGVLQKLEQAVPSLVRTRSVPDWDIGPTLEGALKVLGDARDRGMPVRDLLDQTDLEGGVASEPVAQLARFLDRAKKADVTEAFRRYGQLAQEARARNETVDVFGELGPTPEEAQRGFVVAQGGGRPRPVKGGEELPSLFSPEGVQAHLFGEAPTVAETDLGRRPTATATGSLTESLRLANEVLADPSQRGTPRYREALALVNRDRAITPEEIAARAGEEEPPEPLPGQRDIFTVERTNRPGGGPAPAPPIRQGGPLRGPRRAKGAPLPKPSGITVETGRRETILESIRSATNPAKLGGEAETTANIIRDFNAQRARELEIFDTARKDFRRQIQKLPYEKQLAFDDAIEANQPTGDPMLDGAAAVLRTALDRDRKEITALTGKLQNFYEGYLPHLWADPPERVRSALAQVEGKRPLQGGATFLKRRSYMTLREGIEAGLTPRTYNPMDLAMIKHREMRRYIMANQITEELKGLGLAQFVGIGEKGPEGWTKVDDPLFTVHGPPHVDVSQNFDAGVKEALDSVIGGLPGLRHERTTGIGGSRWGYAVSTGKEMVTRFGSDLGTIMHELGHILDFRYKLWNQLTDIPGKDKPAIAARKQMHAELRELADLRYEGVTPTPGFKSYTRNRYEKVANAIHALIYAPDRMEQVAPTVKARLEGILASRPELQPILKIRPGLRMGVETQQLPVHGMRTLGHYYVPKEAGHVLTNFLMPGLRGKAWYDGYMTVGNTLNQAQLGFSAFHLGMTTMEQLVSQGALGVGDVLKGVGTLDPKRVGRGALELVTMPAAPVTQAIKGYRLRKEIQTPGSVGGHYTDLADAFTRGGGRVTADFHALHRQAFQEAVELGQPGRAAAHVIPAFFETMMKPIMEHIVPVQKLGVFHDLAARALEDLPKGASPIDVRRAMARAWDSVDNRMGQVVYDNLFWNKTYKDLLHATVRSVGWNWGTFRELGGGSLDWGKALIDMAKGKRPELTSRMEYAIALPITVGLTGAFINKMYGNHVESWKDLFFPRTGRKDADGNDDRLQLPTYMRDVFAYASDLRHGQPLNTLKHKLHPGIGAIVDMLQNKDYWGDMIADPDDPAFKRWADRARYAIEQVEPFTFRNISEQKQRGQSKVTEALNYVGVTPARREFVRTDAENAIMDIRGRDKRAMTPTEKKQAEARGTALRQLRQDDTEGFYQTGENANLQPSEMQRLARRRFNDPWVERFKALPADQALHVFKRGTPAEQEAWRPILEGKLSRAGMTDEIPPE